MNVIEIIKAKVKQIRKSYDVYLARITKEDVFNDLDDFLSFLDTLKEEPVCYGLEEELDSWRHIHFRGNRDGHYSGEYLTRDSQLDLARYFAQWGAEHLGDEIPNSLNESADYARRQVEELLSVIKKYNDYSEEQIEELRTHLMAMFLEGAGWQKKQMLKEAVPFYQILKEVSPGPQRKTTRVIIIKEN